MALITRALFGSLLCFAFSVPSVKAQLLIDYSDYQQEPLPPVFYQENQAPAIEVLLDKVLTENVVEPQPEFVQPAKQLTQLEPSKPKAPWQPLFSAFEPQQPKASSNGQDPVDLQADQMQHNEDTGVITASGNVMVQQTGRTLLADQVSYSLDEDKITAEGRVILNDDNGDVHYSNRMELKNKLQDGNVDRLRSFLSDGSRITAKKGKRTGANVTEMKSASYTPCELCADDPDASPPWQIKASKVTHDKEEQKISYQNARFELFGVPVAYTPYFSHTDGTVERKSGFLNPVFGFQSELGSFVGPQYYWNIAPDKDATFGVIAFTDQDPMAFGQWRQRWDNASVEINGSITNSERIRQEDGMNVTLAEEFRGHLTGEALWNMNEKWHSGVNLEWASDDQYMRQYNIRDIGVSTRNVLRNEVFAERFSGRNYAVGRMLAFQDTRVGDNRQNDQPQVLPEVILSYKGEPNSVPVVKGNWEFNGSFLGLRREGESQDMNRFSAEGAWYRHMVSDYGFLTDVRASVRGDLYNTRDRDVAVEGSGQSGTITETRLYPNLNIETSYPVAKEFETMQMVIQPTASLTLSPNIDVNNDIPNEDSEDVQIDASNIFEANRFPGLDRVEDQSRVTYGILTGLYGHEGSKVDLFLGQTHRFSDDDNPFPGGSGLSTQDSDIVGRLSALYGSNTSLDYRFQLDHADFASQRHEVDAIANLGKFTLNGRYLFATGVEGIDLIDTDDNQGREQLRGNLIYRINDTWRVRTGAIQDFGNQAGLRRAELGFDYLGECISLYVLGRRNLVDRATGASQTEVLFRIGLKNLGEFQASGLSIDGSRQ